QHGGSSIPGFGRTLHILLTILGFPGVALAHHVIINIRQSPEEGFLTRTESPLDKLDNTHLHAIAQSPGHHAKAGPALAFAGAVEHQHPDLFFLRVGDALVHDLLFCSHALSVAFGVLGAFTHENSPWIRDRVYSGKLYWLSAKDRGHKCWG